MVGLQQSAETLDADDLTLMIFVLRLDDPASHRCHLMVGRG
jgi:hypothetical protein